MRLEIKKGRTIEFVELIQNKRALVTRRGSSLVRTKERTQSYKTTAAVRQAYDKGIAALLAKGYRDPDRLGTPAGDTPRDAALEAAIRANPGDPGAYDVYADWLLQRGSPLGELIAMSRGNKAARVKKLVGALGLPGENRATFGWRWGMWEWVRLESTADLTQSTLDVGALARSVFGQPMCAALEELRIGVLRWEHNFLDVPAVIDEAKRHAWASDLARLKLGDVDNIDMAHHTIGDIGRRISKTFPRLQKLTLHSGEWTHEKVETFGVAGLALPELRELVVETCSMTKDRLAALLSAKLPALERLELWFGSADYNATSRVRDLKRLLDGRVHAGVVHLGLKNAEFANELAATMPAAAVAGRLESLDLSMGTMTDDGATALIAGRKAFRALKALSVDKNFLTPAGERAVKKAFPFATTAAQNEPDNSIEGETHYYVSVSE